jgi:acyl-CoA thioester hydrolase
VLFTRTIRRKLLLGVGLVMVMLLILSASGILGLNSYCNFIRQLEYPGDVLAKHYVASPGRTSFEAYITLERIDEPGVLYATGGAKTVWVNFPRGKSVPLPDKVRRLVE